ncbi:MAG: phosphoribosyltransferase family protein [Chloroflexi bacterium]|nr:phosphoribosyltransferase family protein [Chloroflexota bacterium]
MSGAGGRARGERGSGERLWLTDLLWRLGCVQFGDYTLGRTVENSPVFVNPKLIIARPGGLARIARLIDDELRTALSLRHRPVQPFQLIAGVPIGGLHIATALSLQMGQPLLYVRPRPAWDTRASRVEIEGIYRPGNTALVVDDLAAGGGSLVEAVLRLREAGIYVHDAVVLIDREQGAERRLQQIGVRLHPILTLEVLLTFLHGQGRISDDEHASAIRYLRGTDGSRSEFD